MKKVLFVIANRYFQDFEFRMPRDILAAEWYDITVCAEYVWICTGAFWYQVEATISLADAQWSIYDMIVFIGGGWALQQYQGGGAATQQGGAVQQLPTNTPTTTTTK